MLGIGKNGCRSIWSHLGRPVVFKVDSDSQMQGVQKPWWMEGSKQDKDAAMEEFKKTHLYHADLESSIGFYWQPKKSP